MSAVRAVRPLPQAEFERVVDYFHAADEAALRRMGVDPAKLPARDAWLRAAAEQYARPPEARELFFVGWYLDGEPVGHSNMSHHRPGESAKIHLHLWQPTRRQRGLGTWFFAESIRVYAERFALPLLICEPKADNPGPNRVLQRLGYTPVRTYATTPGPINFPQEVTRYELRL